MRKSYVSILILLLLSILVLNAGCSNDENKIAYLTSNNNSKYQSTFTDLNFGILYDYNLKLPNADKSWVKIWVEVTMMVQK